LSERIIRLRKYLAEQDLDGIIISKPRNRRYFSGFTGSAGMLLVTREKLQLVTDFRYMEQAEQQAVDCEIVRVGAQYGTVMQALCQQAGVSRVGFESDFETWDGFRDLSQALTSISLHPLSLDFFRMVKDEKEIVAIREAVRIADEAFSHVLSFIKPGIQEIDVASELEYAMRKLGSQRPAFDTIAVSGWRGALPHGLASAKLLEPGDMLTLDFGAVYDGYHSDITRTVVLGQAQPKQREIYDLVLRAQRAGVEAVAAGRRCVEVDAIARRIIAEAGYGEYFGHGLGHSLGLAIHEAPRLAPGAGDAILEENMIVTVEPGIYLPGWGGVRIEDTVLVSAGQGVILTASTKNMLELEW
jgi:Xaa-Pro aminopeptidase